MLIWQFNYLNYRVFCRFILEEPASVEQPMRQMRQMSCHVKMRTVELDEAWLKPDK